MPSKAHHSFVPIFLRLKVFPDITIANVTDKISNLFGYYCHHFIPKLIAASCNVWSYNSVGQSNELKYLSFKFPKFSLCNFFINLGTLIVISGTLGN